MNTFKHRQCYEIITSLDDIHPFKVLENGNASYMNIIKVTGYNTCSPVLQSLNFRSIVFGSKSPYSNCIIKSRLYYALINIHQNPRNKNMSQSAKS